MEWLLSPGNYSQINKICGIFNVIHTDKPLAYSKIVSDLTELSPNIRIKVSQTLRSLGSDCVCAEGTMWNIPEGEAQTKQ